MIVAVRYLAALFLLFTQVLIATELKPSTTVSIPMRDGITLLTDLYLPSPEARHLPCILIRLPAGRDAQPWVSYAALSKLGYVVAIQDTRSAIDPEGKTLPFVSDGWEKLQDGFDAVEWLAKSEYTNGKIGTLGFSAAGITQVLLAPSNPPGLKCQYIGTAFGSLYHHAIYPGGQLLKNQVEGWLGKYARDQGVLGAICAQPFYNALWAKMDAIKVANRVTVPGLFYGGWYDTFLQGTIDAFVSRQNNGGVGAKGTQKLIIGPWTHHYPLLMTLGDFQVPKVGYAPIFDMSPQHWFDFYLKGIPNGASEIAPINYYVMGPFDGSPSSGNIWKSAQVWPIPATKTSFYLTADHKLDVSLPKRQGILSYLYDPRHPIPTIGGCNLFLDSGPKDQQSFEHRTDLLLFTSDLMKEDLEITGQVVAKLFFSSDVPDTDVVVRLTDVYPDGRSILILDGLQRMEFNEASNEPVEVTVNLPATSIVIAKNHRIRISVSSSNYPKYEKNLNVGYTGANLGQFAIAHNKFYVGNDHPSRIELPVIERTK